MGLVYYATEATALKNAERSGFKKPIVTEHKNGKFSVKESPLYQADARKRSKCGNPVKTVWDLCFNHPEAKRRDIVTMAIEMGVSKNTAATQYQYWRSAELSSKKGAK